MMMVVTIVTLLSRLPHGLSTNRSCVPNKQFIINGRLCRCDGVGSWTEANCYPIGKRNDVTNCLPGQIIWQGCRQCICQENKQLLCSNASCLDNTYKVVQVPIRRTNYLKEIYNSWCTPFRSYYVNCSLCLCPATGKMSEARCAHDKSCQKLPASSSDLLESISKIKCIPKVMYLFPCLYCLCSDSGNFVLEECVETCHQRLPTEFSRRCISNTFYRKACNVCWCPGTGVSEDELCTQTICTKDSKFRSLRILNTARSYCHPYSFNKPKCYYCACNNAGFVDEDNCLELECLKIQDFKYDYTKTTCSPGEMVSSCVECFCLQNGLTNRSYCTTECSYNSKLRVLQNIINDSLVNKGLIKKADIETISKNEKCQPNTVYFDHERYCLCPENGSTNFKLCTSITDEIKNTRSHTSSNVYTDIKKCIPNTFVEIDCNTCYCSKNGTIDTKWCTYDDCKSKKIVQDTNKKLQKTAPTVQIICIPGSISQKDCNFCICPKSGLLKERVCTKNECSEIKQNTDQETFACEPLDYYLVDCNVCLCPRDGIKNVAKCTKKACEKTNLRSNSCVPGRFFSYNCDICVCPPNGDKSDRICMNHRCSDYESPWQKKFRVSENLLDNDVEGRQLDQCFSGEEFEVGCKMCVCPDVGLRSYAMCVDSRCENHVISNFHNMDLTDLNEGGEVSYIQPRRTGEICKAYNLTYDSEKKECIRPKTIVDDKTVQKMQAPITSLKPSTSIQSVRVQLQGT